MRGLVACIILIAFTLPRAHAAEGKGCVRKGIDAVVRELANPMPHETARRAVLRQFGSLFGQTFKLLRNKQDLGEVMFFPILGPFSLLAETARTVGEGGAKAVWKIPFRLVRKKGGVIVGGVFVTYAAGRFHIDQVDFDEESREFEDQLGKHPYVYVSMLAPGDALGGVPEYDFANGPGKRPNTHFVQVRDFVEMMGELERIQASQGPIHGLQIFTHGAPGAMFHGEENLTQQLRELNASPEGYPSLAPGGKIKLNSCLVGLGKKGERYVEDLGKLLLPGGGVIYSARVPIMSNGPKLWKKQGRPEESRLWKALEWSQEHMGGMALPNLINQAMWAYEADSTELGIMDQVRKTRIKPRKR